jgi:MFS transporter, FHS family, glucose/mannose:H+ symporter
MEIGLRERLPLYPSQFITGLVVASLGPLLDPMMKDLGLSLSRGGLISLGFFVGQVAGIVVVNVCMAHVSAKGILVYGALLQAAGLAAAGLLSTGIRTLFLAFFVLGIGWALLNTIGWMWAPVHIKRGTASALLQMTLFFALGNMLGPLVLGVLLRGGAGWRPILAAEGAASVLFALVFTVLPFRDITERENLRIGHAREVVRFNPALISAMLIAGFLYAGIETSFGVWLPKFQIDTFRATDLWASVTVSFFWGGLIIGRLAALRLARIFFPSRLVVACGAGLALFSVAIAVSPRQVATLALALGAGLGASATFGLLGSYSSKFPAWHAGVVSSAYLLVGGAGSMVFPYLMGPLASTAGFRMAFGVLAVPAIVYALLALVVHTASREGRGAAPEETLPAAGDPRRATGGSR